MVKPVGKCTTNLLRLVQERKICKDKEKKKEEDKYFVPDIPKDCIYKILMKLPIESLQGSRFVCKPWFNMINNSLFVEEHLQRHQTEMVLIFQSMSSQSGTSSNGNVFDVDKHLQSHQEQFSIFQRPTIEREEKFNMQFMEINGGTSVVRSLNLCCLGKIKATCNGLILLEHKQKLGGSLVINPVTRKLVPIPLGTISYQGLDAHGFFFSSSSQEYRVVHLFRDSSGYVGCEIINVGSRSWRAIDGPKYGVFIWPASKPVFAIGALHWWPPSRSEYLVTMGIEDEKFRQIPLPKICRSYDGLIEMGGVLAFFHHVNPNNQIDIWILKDLDGDWTLKHSITVGCVRDMRPVGCSRNDSEVLVFNSRKDKCVYTYDIEQQEMKKIEIMEGCFAVDGAFLPHVNSLVSWKNRRGQRLEDI